MHIDPADDYRGIPMLEFRERLRAAVSANPVDDYFEFHFDAELIEGLLQDGYVEAAPDGENPWRDDHGGGHFRATAKAFQVINASASKPIRRAAAMKALEGLLSRMTDTEQDPFSWWVVNRAALFGSILDIDRERFSDVDVAIELIPHPDPSRKPPPEALETLSDAALRRKSVPKDFRWRDDTQVLKALRKRQRSLNLMKLDERGIAGLGWEIPHRFIYDRDRGGRMDGGFR